MPTMKKLATEIASDPDIAASARAALTVFSGDLEQWMSFLSVDQPWLTAVQNLENRATFVRVTELVQASISAAEEEVVGRDCPDWLLRLVWTLADEEASVFTFNYDTLLERAIGMLQRSSSADLYRAPLLQRSAGVGMAIGADGPRGLIPALYKLHGSVNWAFGGIETPPNDPIVLKSDGERWAPAAQPEGQIAPRQAHLYDDLQPLVVPPTFSKGPYFANRALQAQWRSSAASLAACRNLAILGYSLPAGDLVARQWLATSFKGDAVLVVNPDEDVAERVQDLFPNVKVDHLPSIDDFVRATTGPLVRWKIAIPSYETAELRLQVDGEDLLPSIDPSDPPWDPSSQTPTDWVWQILETVLPRNWHKALYLEGSTPPGGESKWVVMPKEWALDRAALGAALAIDAG